MDNKVTIERKIIKDGEKVTAGVNEEQDMEGNPVPSSSGTSTGFIMPGDINAGTLIPIAICGNSTTLNINQPLPSIPHPNKRIQFNIQDCVHTFTGRDEFIKTLHEKIWNSQLIENSPIRSRFMVIYGMAGVGKTQVARKYIQTHKHLYHHVVWINAEKQSDAISSFRGLANEIHDVNHGGRQKADEVILDEVYNFICQKYALIVYDNVGSYNTEDGKDGLQKLLPQTVRTGWMVPSIIVTTRNRNWTDFMVQELNGFELSTSLSFLAELKFEDTEENQKLLKEIADLYQGLPLVLQQVLHYVRNKRKRRSALDESYTLSDFLSEVNLKRKKIISTKPADLAHPDVYTLFDMTFEDIAKMSSGKNALQCLDIMAILNPDFIPTVLLKYIFRNYKKELKDGLTLLHDYNLVTKCNNHYQMHRIVQVAKIEFNNYKFELKGISEKCGNSLQKITLFSKGKFVELPFEEILDSICELTQNTAIHLEFFFELLNNIVRVHDQALWRKSDKFLEFQSILGNKLYEAGNYTQASKVIRIVVETRTKTQGPNSLMTIKENFLLAIICSELGKFDDAEKRFNEILDKLIKILGPDHLDTLNVKKSLAVVFKNQGKYKEAEKLYNEVLEKQFKIVGPDHPETLDLKQNLAVVFKNQGKYKEAEKLYNEVLDKRIKILDPDHLDTLGVKQNLATLFINQGKYNDAEKLYNEFLGKQIKILGPDHPDTLNAKQNLAVVFKNQGKYKEAEKLYNEVLDKRIKILDPDHLDTLGVKQNLATLFMNQGKYNDAEKLYNEFLEKQIKILGPDHPDTLNVKQNLATVFINQGKYNDAEKLCNEFLEKQIKILGPDHLDTLDVKHILAILFQFGGKYNAAEEIYNEVLRMQIKILGAEHVSTVWTKHNLARLFENQGKYELAEELQNIVLNIRIRELGRDHPETLWSKYNVALVFLKQGRHHDAEKFNNEVLELQLEKLGPNHPETLLTKHSLAQVFHIQGKYYDAEALLNTVLEGQFKMLGPDHPDILLTKRTLAGVFLHQGKSTDAEQICKEVLELQILKLGPEHPETLLTKHSLAGIFQNQGQTDDAKILYDETLQMQIKVLGPDHPDTLKTKLDIEKLSRNFVAVIIPKILNLFF